MQDVTEQCGRGVGKTTRPAHQQGTPGANPRRPLFYHYARYDDARHLVERFHYTGRMASNTQAVVTAHESGGLFGDAGDAVAACVFSIPPTRWSSPVWELSRLVMAPGGEVPLTQLISVGCKRVRQLKRVSLVVSFADAGERHHGGVYQAAGWNYHGFRKPQMEGVYIDGAFYPGRSCNSIFGTRSPDSLQTMMPTREIKAAYDSGKHLYWKAVHNNGQRDATRLGLTHQPYPKPDKD